VRTSYENETNGLELIYKSTRSHRHSLHLQDLIVASSSFADQIFYKRFWVQAIVYVNETVSHFTYAPALDSSLNTSEFLLFFGMIIILAPAFGNQGG